MSEGDYRWRSGAGAEEAPGRIRYINSKQCYVKK